MRDLIVMASVMVLAPLAGLVFASTAGRVAFLLLGLALFSVEFLVHFGGRNPFSIIPFFGACLALAALLAEILVRGARLARTRAPTPDADEGPGEV